MLKKILYTIWLILFFFTIFVSVKNANLRNFISVIENRTFDLRQNVMIKENTKSYNDDIVIIAIDDASYEYILDKYGEWPIPRNIYAELVNYIEKQNPKSIAFDLMFVRSMKSNPKADQMLVDMMKKYDNVFVAMNFDDQSPDLRTPPILPDKLSIKLDDTYRNIDFRSLTFTNCRGILQGIIDASSNIGMINVTRADDGVLRKMPVMVRYQHKFYPELGLKLGMHYLGIKPDKLIVDSNSNLLLGDRKIFLDEDGGAILNWYGGQETYEYIPIYKLMQILNGKHPDIGINFKDKIVYFGTTASSLFDIKTVPSAKVYPGVEIQATYLNNIIDNNFIRKVDRSYTILLGVLLALITVIIVMNEASPFVGSLAAFSVYLLYVFGTYYAMKYFNLWIDIIYPLLLAIITFISAYIVKYILKSRDFELQYLLATTDGLTDLYNHRYFQEQMQRMVDSSKRYSTTFSLIILDIDFFKKFNDTYGHQAGDAVLRQVAQTLKKNIRSTDIACRYGGEEMSIILPNTEHDVAIYTAQKICERVSAKPFKLPNGKETSVTISLGVSTFPVDGDTREKIIEAADTRLYHAKNNGRNQVGE